jgi:hypothetical protein
VAEVEQVVLEQIIQVQLLVDLQQFLEVFQFKLELAE